MNKFKLRVTSLFPKYDISSYEEQPEGNTFSGDSLDDFDLIPSPWVEFKIVTRPGNSFLSFGLRDLEKLSKLFGTKDIWVGGWTEGNLEADGGRSVIMVTANYVNFDS